MNILRFIVIFVVVSLVACSQEPGSSGASPAAEAQQSADSEARPDPANPSGGSAGDETVAADVPAGDPGNGMRMFLQCQACHTIEPGGPHKLGPNLGNLFGKPAGSAEGYVYSPSLASSGIVWDAESLDQWIARPADLVPGTTMVFAGIPDAEARANLIAYLYESTAQ